MSMLRCLPSTLALIASCALLQPAGAATITPGQIARPEGTRHYLLARPTQATAGLRPLVILLHGHGASASMTFGKENIDDPAAAWLAVADREHLLVLAVDGWKGSDGKQGWNDCRADAPTNPKTDDVGLIAALIDKAIADEHADPRRIYISGISNGGGMTYRAAIELGPRLAGVAVLSALMPAHSLCAAPTYPLPILITHGTNDKIAPYLGGEVGHWLLSGRGSGIGAEQSVQLWRVLDQLPPTPTVTPIAHRDSRDKTSATRYVWGSDPTRLQVEFLKIEHGGHAQPSIAHRLSWLATSLLGAQNGDVEFADEAWAFFRDKRQP